MPIKPVDWQHVTEDALAILGGALLTITAGAAIYYIAQNTIGVPSYLGLTGEEIDRVTNEFRSQCKTVSSVELKNGDYRGVWNCGGGVLQYYHYSPGKELHVYPLLWDEAYKATPDYFGTTGKLIYPTPNPQTQNQPTQTNQNQSTIYTP